MTDDLSNTTSSTATLPLKTINDLSDIPAVRTYLNRISDKIGINATIRSMRRAVFQRMSGKYPEDIATIEMTKEGIVKATEFGKDRIAKASDQYAPTELEVINIKADCAGARWPEILKLGKHYELPAELKKAKRADIYEFFDLDDKLIMLQLRVDTENGKAYLPFTYWTDNKWRQMEPDGPLPLWGLDQLKEGSSIVFIHEGAKAARAMRDLVDPNATHDVKAKLAAHPWGKELSIASHIGWIGGAKAPHRSDWTPLMKSGVKQVFIVSDNDPEGVAAVPHISKQLRVPTFHVQFTQEWPNAFDLADDFPAKMFKPIKDHLHYVGPPLRKCLHPATWATDLIPQPKGPPAYRLRESFEKSWSWLVDMDLFVCTDFPEMRYDKDTLNSYVRPFSGVKNTVDLLLQSYTRRQYKFVYRPDLDNQRVTDEMSSINLHLPSLIQSVSGDPTPWLEFLAYLVPVQSERKEVERWCATLIAKLGIRMEYGLLFASEEQGIGKTTLGASILAPLVGMRNTVFPGQHDLTSEFNSWTGEKRLAVINEIYAGTKAKTYNLLKSLITDSDILINEKYKPKYQVENWCHFFACSNSYTPLKMDDNDRRWYMPELTEKKWPKAKFETFHKWLACGGLSIIKHWAENYGDYVAKGEAAPASARKTRMLMALLSPHEAEAGNIAEALRSYCELEADGKSKKLGKDDEPIQKACALIMLDVRKSIINTVGDKFAPGDDKLRKEMIKRGAFVFEERVKVKGRNEFILMNETLRDEVDAKKKELDGVDDPKRRTRIMERIRDFIRSHVRDPDGLLLSSL